MSARQASEKNKTMEIPLTLLQTSQRDAIYPKWLAVVLALLPNCELNKNKVHHIPHAVERNAQFFLPNGVEPIIFDNLGLERDRPSRRNARRGGVCRWRIFGSGCCCGFRKERRVRPIRNMEGDLDEGIHD